MRVYVYPADLHGCGHYRLAWPAEVLRVAGHDIVTVAPNERAASFKGLLNADGKLVDAQVPEDADVIVLQRITHEHLVDAITILRGRGIAVVIDMDDDLAAIHPGNPAFVAMHPVHGKSPAHNWANAQRACEVATLVTVSTDALAPRYAPHGRFAVLRNAVPGRYLDVPRVDSPVVGWGGALGTHPGDVEVVGTALAQLTREGITFRVVGPPDGVRQALRLDTEPESTGPVDIGRGWPREVSRLGVGVAPLADTRFNAAKSWLKPLEYAALGVPCVMSPRTEYARLHAEGVGVLARKPRQWLTALRRLVSDESWRLELSERGRAVARAHIIEDHAWRWAEAWERAYKIEH